MAASEPVAWTPVAEVAGLYPQIAALYQVPAPAEVQAFLDRHAFLVPLLVEARPAISGYFPDSPVILEVVADPETPEWVELVATVVPRTPPEDAFARYRRFQREWWIPRLPQARNALLIMPEYRALPVG